MSRETSSLTTHHSKSTCKSFKKSCGSHRETIKTHNFAPLFIDTKFDRKIPISHDHFFLMNMNITGTARATKRRVVLGESLSSKDRKLISKLRYQYDLTNNQTATGENDPFSVASALWNTVGEQIAARISTISVLDFTIFTSDIIQKWEACRTWIGIGAVCINIAVRTLGLLYSDAITLSELIALIIEKSGLSIIGDRSDLPDDPSSSESWSFISDDDPRPTMSNSDSEEEYSTPPSFDDVSYPPFPAPTMNNGDAKGQSISDFTSAITRILDAALLVKGFDAAKGLVHMAASSIHSSAMAIRDLSTLGSFFTLFGVELITLFQKHVLNIVPERELRSLLGKTILSDYHTLKNTSPPSRDLHWANKLIATSSLLDELEVSKFTQSSKDRISELAESAVLLPASRWLKTQFSAATTIVRGSIPPFEPVAYMLAGIPGTGKTSLLWFISGQVMSALYNINDPGELRNLAYPRPPGERMDGFSEVFKSLIYDDWFGSQDSLTRGKQAMELVQIVSPTVYRPEMAALDLKAALQVCVDLLGLSANLHLHEGTNLGVTDINALIRRFCKVTVTFNDRYSDESGARYIKTNAPFASAAGYDEALILTIDQWYGRKVNVQVTVHEFICILITRIQDRKTRSLENNKFVRGVYTKLDLDSLAAKFNAPVIRNAEISNSRTLHWVPYFASAGYSLTSQGISAVSKVVSAEISGFDILDMETLIFGMSTSLSIAEFESCFDNLSPFKGGLPDGLTVNRFGGFIRSANHNKRVRLNPIATGEGNSKTYPLTLVPKERIPRFLTDNPGFKFVEDLTKIEIGLASQALLYSQFVSDLYKYDHIPNCILCIPYEETYIHREILSRAQFHLPIAEQKYADYVHQPGSIVASRHSLGQWRNVDLTVYPTQLHRFFEIEDTVSMLKAYRRFCLAHKDDKEILSYVNSLKDETSFRTVNTPPLIDVNGIFQNYTIPSIGILWIIQLITTLLLVINFSWWGVLAIIPMNLLTGLSQFLTKWGSITFYNFLCKYFSYRASRAKAHMHAISVTIITGVFVALTALGSYKFVSWLSSSDAQKYASADDNNKKPKRLKAPKVKITERKVAGRGQGPNSALDQIRQNTYKTSQFFLVDTNSNASIQCLGIGRGFYLTTRHEYELIKTCSRVSLVRENYHNVINFIDCKIFEFESGSYKSEIIALDLGVYSKELWKKFRKGSDWVPNGLYSAVLSTCDLNNGQFTNVVRYMSKAKLFMSTVNIKAKNYLQPAWCYLSAVGKSNDGNCSGPWFIDDRTCQRTIAGIHMANWHGTPLCGVIFQEWLSDLMDLRPNNQHNFDDVDADGEYSTVRRVFPNTQLIGNLPHHLSQSQNVPVSKLKLTGLSGTPASAPAYDTFKTANGCNVALHKHVLKFARITKCPHDFYEICTPWIPLLAQVAQMTDGMMATLSESLNGDPRYDSSAINLKAGKGFPTNREFPGKGKSPCVFRHSDGDIRLSKAYLTQFNKFMYRMLNSLGYHNISCLAWKDETLPIEKVALFKVRLYMPGTLHAYLLGDRILGRFFSVMSHNPHFYWFGPGIDMNGADAHITRQLLVSNDCDENRVILLDIKGMDISLHKETMLSTFRLIRKGVTLTEVPKQWKMLFDSFVSLSINQIWSFLNTIFFVDGKMSSGCRFTAEFNSLILSFKLYYCFVKGMIARGYTAEEASRLFFDDIRFIVYGDDSLITIRKSLYLWFTPMYIINFMKENFGMEFTGSDKKAIAQYSTLAEASFLQRKWILVNGFWRAARSIDAILDGLFYWKDDGLPKNLAVEAKVQSALGDLSQHGIVVYRKQSRLLNKRLVKAGYDAVIIPYHVHQTRYLNTFK